MEGSRKDAHVITGSSAATHSQILQAWVEGGILGVSFFLVFGFQLLKTLPAQLLSRRTDLLTPTLLFYQLYALWSLFMSPFAATTRLLIALGATALLLTYLDVPSVGRSETARSAVAWPGQKKKARKQLRARLR
jgi:O-antigen ligase